MARNHYIFKLFSLLAAVLSISAASPAFAESDSQNIDDQIITSNVRDAIRNNPDLYYQEVIAGTSNGVVSLSGRVDTQAQESEAVEVACCINGVVSVIDNIIIKVRRNQ